MGSSAAFAVLVVLAGLGGSDVRATFEDPIVAGGLSPVVGMISQLGAVGWAATVGICLVAFLALRGSHDGRYFGFAAILTTWLMVDDLFTIHETFDLAGYPRFALFGVLGMLTAWMLVAHWTVAFERRSAPLMVGSLGLLAVAAAIDVFGLDSATADLAQNFTKFVGLGLWLAFHASRAVDLLRSPGTNQTQEH